MKKLLYSIFASTVLLFAAVSCNDVLEQDAVDTFNPKLVFSDINVVKAFLGKTYDRMGGDTDAGILGGREDLLSSGTDQTLCIHRPSNYVMIKGTMSPDQLGYFVNNGLGGYLRWNNLYANIQNVNRILAGIDDVPLKAGEEAVKTQIKGEAYFIRAYDYAVLMMVYGGSILQDKPFNLGEDYLSVNRSSIKETLDFILKDINSAIEHLPENIEQGRASRGAAMALRSRVLLFAASKLTNGGYEANNPLVSFPAGSQTTLLQQARDAAKQIIDSGKYALVGSTDDPPSPMTEADVQAYANTYFNIFNQKAAWNTETIWGIQFPVTGGNVNNANLWYGPNGYHNWGNNNPTEPMVRAYEMADGTPFVWDAYNPGNMELRTATAAELAADPLRSPYNGREPRFYASVLYHGAPWQQRPSDAAGLEPNNVIETGYWYANVGDAEPYKKGIDTRQGLIEAWNGTKTGYYIKKLLDPATAGQYFRNTNTWVEFRYAEVLLNYAEACIELGGADLQNGINALNMVRNRAGLPDRVTTDQATAREYLRHERNIEFFAEGHRFYDMRRWMIANEVIKDVHEMKVRLYDNGYIEWLLDKNAVADSRVFNDNKFYWVPFPRDEMNKAPQLQQNPGYN